MGPRGRKSGRWGAPLRGGIRTLATSSLSLHSKCHVVTRPLCRMFCHDVWGYHRPKTTGQVALYWNLWNMSQTNCFPYEVDYFMHCILVTQWDEEHTWYGIHIQKNQQKVLQLNKTPITKLRKQAKKVRECWHVCACKRVLHIYWYQSYPVRDTLPFSGQGMLCYIGQVGLEIWMLLPLPEC
jgi:hypothetical protein